MVQAFLSKKKFLLQLLLREGAVVMGQACGLWYRGGKHFFDVRFRGGEHFFEVTFRGVNTFFSQV